MKAILETILREETKTLKTQYIEMTKEWAVKEFNSLREFAIKYQNFRFEDIKDGKISRFAYGEMQKKYHKLPHYIVNSNGKVEQHVEKMVKYAELHYESSILKLATRIEKKGLNQANLKVVTSHIGVNINTTLTDGEKTVRAFTIIAEGEVQRPHYRYLVK